MVRMAVGEQHQIDIRFGQAARGRSMPLQRAETHAQERVGQDPEPGDVDPDRGVPDEADLERAVTRSMRR